MKRLHACIYQDFTCIHKHDRIEFYNTCEYKFCEKILECTSLRTQVLVFFIGLRSDVRCRR